jgi:hypothetical protein
MGKTKKSSPWLRTKQGFRGYPAATVALYGPTADLATKIVVAIFAGQDTEPDPLERWFSDGTEIRRDPEIGGQVIAFIKNHDAKSVVVTDGIIGCPHEEGVDYPEGKSCPQCPFWAGRDRFTYERIH